MNRCPFRTADFARCAAIAAVERTGGFPPGFAARMRRLPAIVDAASAQAAVLALECIGRDYRLSLTPANRLVCVLAQAFRHARLMHPRDVADYTVGVVEESLSLLAAP